MDGQTDICTDVQIPPVLKDFVSSGSLQSRCPKKKGRERGNQKLFSQCQTKAANTYHSVITAIVALDYTTVAVALLGSDC